LSCTIFAASIPVDPATLSARCGRETVVGLTGSD
jgi:hypothetical protein